MIRNENLDFWVQNHYNVLFVGHAGVGKTSIVKAAFERQGLNHRYFSASTMDPWVDLVGVPKERIEDGEAYLDLIRPKGLDQVEAFFFDEFNRSHKKVRNACMELLQFKTINGRPFPNLKIIWAAINPDDDDTYDVEKLDPAQKDRFHIYVDIPYKPDRSYFTNKYGDTITRAALAWWGEMPEQVRRTVSPRRLDYALDILEKNGDVRYVLPEASNVGKLLTTLKHGPIQDMIEKLYKDQDLEEARKWLAVENTYQSAIDYIKKSEHKSMFFLPLVNTERLSTLASDPAMLRFMLKNCSDSEIFSKVLVSIYEAKQNKTAVGEIEKAIKNQREVAEALGYDTKAGFSLSQWPMGKNPINPYYAFPVSNGYADALTKNFAEFGNAGGTQAVRKKLYKFIVDYIPMEMTVEESLSTLKCLNAIALRSQHTTLKNSSNLIGIINNCMLQIHKKEGRTINQIVKKYAGSYFRAIWKKIRSDKELSAGLIPYGQEQGVA